MKICLFDDWKFYLADQKEPDFDKIDMYPFRKVQLPHDWSTDYPVDSKLPTCGSGGYVVAGIGYYQRKFEIDAPGEQVVLYFEGSYMKTTVYVNGKEAGGHIYGYTPFEVDITDLITKGENDLLVVVDNSLQPGSRWYSGSGLTRDVWLETRKPLHIARYGTYLTTDLSKMPEAVLYVEVTLHASMKQELLSGLKPSLEFALFDENSVKVAEGVQRVESSFEKASGDAAIMTGLDEAIPEDLYSNTLTVLLSVNNPTLWSPDTPTLYTLQITLKNQGQELDFREEQIGFRSLEFHNRKGFLLNNEQMKINGVCLHHDGGCVGAAVPPAIWERRLKKLKEMGVNGIRCSHNPPDVALLNLCDQMGFLVMDEAFDEWALMKDKEVGANTHESHGYSTYFEKCHEWDLKTMLYRDRNHTSIFLWSIGNEIPEETVEDGERLARKLRDFCHAVDPSRKITLAHDQIVAEPHPARQEFMEEIDVVGYNYVGRWRKRAERFYDEDHEAYPHRCVIGTENPSAGYVRSTYRLDYDRNSFWDKPYYTAAVSVGKLLRYTMTHDFVAGDFMWTGIDYLGESNWPQKSSGCGVLDTCGFEKDSFYFYKSVWDTKEPFAYLCPHWNLSVDHGTVLPVICYTNCEDAELFVNGKSYGMKSKGFPCYGMTEKYGHFDRYRRPANTDDLFLSWDVPYESGEIEVIGYRDEKEVCRYKVETTGTATVIEAKCDRTSVKADGRSIVQVEIRLLDEANRVDLTACNSLNYKLEGDAKIIGIDNGCPECHELWKETRNRTAFNGLAYCVIRAGKTAGEVKLTVEGEGLTSAQLVFEQQ